MNFHGRRTRPFPRVFEARRTRPGSWLAAGLVVGMLLVEVWQTSTIAQLSLRLDRTRSASVESSARLEFRRADLERRNTRTELAPLASQLGLSPADVQQVVTLPAEYLAAEEPTTHEAAPASMLAWAERASRVVVPEATARSRGER